MKTTPLGNFFKLLRGREIQFRAVIITALASYILQLSAILLHWHLWAIALVTIIPWIPLFTMKVLWTSRHYGFMAIYMCLMIVQAGHVGEHVFQMAEYIFYKEHPYVGRILKVETTDKPTIVKAVEVDPPQGDVSLVKITPRELQNGFSQQRFTATGQPDANGEFKAIVFRGCPGWSWNGPGCLSAHGVFGELDRELIHFVWDGIILIATGILFFKFRKNPWTKWAFLAAAIHQVEHIFLFGASIVDTANYMFVPADAARGLKLPTYFGISVLHPDQGILGNDGILGCLTGCARTVVGADGNPVVVGTAATNGFLNTILPNRINIHFIYNTLVFIPMVLAFRYQLKQIYDEWLAKAMPNLSREQLIRFSTVATNEKFAPNTIIFKQGDAADKFYIITKGNVEILRGDKRGIEKPIANLGEGAYFGEVGILGRTRRTATVKAIDAVETLTLDEQTFRSMVAASADSYKDVDRIVRNRIKQLGEVQGKQTVVQKVEENPDVLVKTRIIQGWLDDMEYRSQVLNWNGLAEPVAGQSSGGPNAGGTFPNAQAAINAPPVPPNGQGYGPPVVQRPPVASVPPNGQPYMQPPGAPPANPTAPYPPGGGVVAPPRLFGSIKVRSGASTGQRFEITGPRAVVGRRSNKASDVPIFMVDDNRVSREHIEISFQPNGVFLRDLGSSNGTWLNGSQVGGMPVLITEGAEIRLGTDTVLTFHLG